MDHKKKKHNESTSNSNFMNYPQNYPLNPNYKQNNYNSITSSNIPPTNQNELEGLVIEYLINNPSHQIDSNTLFRNIKSSFRNCDNSVFVFKSLNINDSLRDLMYKNLIVCEEISINLQRTFLIKQINLEKLKKFKEENSSSFNINQDNEKYNDEAKKIAIKFLNNEFTEIHKKDDLMFNYQINHNFYGNNNNYFYYNNNYNPFSYIQKKRNRDEKNIINNISNNNSNLNLTNAQKSQENSLKTDFPETKDDSIIFFAPTAKAMLSSNNYNDTSELLFKTTDYTSVLEKIKNKYGSNKVKPFCEHGTRAECSKFNKNNSCTKIHFEPIISSHTDVSLGDCSYLDTCRHMEICRFVHYKIEESEDKPSSTKELVLNGDSHTLPSQWVSCDIRYFDSSILGKFDVIMADPPWDIHMDLPYGTLSDDEMKNLPIKNLQDDGVLFLWVTGRATELARECLEIWGYERKEELVWIKTNQLQRLIRTGRTGHWLNHSKEHCLIGIKGNPVINRNVDCDVLVSEVRETSRKPDEIYELIERMKPGGRKLELFARAHNRRKGWISLGNQLPGIYFVEEDMIERFNKTYPENKLTKEIMEKNRDDSTMKKEINE